MDTIILEVSVSEDRRIIIDLPATMPTGPAEVTVRSLGTSSTAAHELIRRSIQAKLRAAGILNTMHSAPHDAMPLSDEERDRLGRLFEGQTAVPLDNPLDNMSPDSDEGA